MTNVDNKCSEDVECELLMTTLLSIQEIRGILKEEWITKYALNYVPQTASVV
jgi:hypothetical protein